MGAHVRPRASTRRIRAAFFLNLAFTVVEAVGGLLIGSVAIVADAIHDLGDTLSLGIALVLQKYAEKGPDRQFSYGYRRWSALSALLTGMILLGGSVFVLAHAVQRFSEPRHPDGLAMLGLALFGLIVNGIAARKLSHGSTQNERMLTWHLLEDVLGWAAVLVGAILIMLFEWVWIDPLLAIGISLFVLWNVVRNLSKTGRLLLQQVPDGLDLQVLEQEISQVAGILGVHDLHAWSLDGEHHVLSCHLVVGEDGESETIKNRVREVIAIHGEYHVTLELERDSETCQQDCEREE